MVHRHPFNSMKTSVGWVECNETQHARQPQRTGILEAHGNYSCDIGAPALKAEHIFLQL